MINVDKVDRDHIITFHHRDSNSALPLLQNSDERERERE